MAGPGYEDGYWYSADGLRLHFRDYPGDPNRAPVLCVPGLTRNARDFEGVAHRLAGKRRVIAVDLRGRGESDYALDPLTYVPPVYLQDLGALIAEHCVRPVVLFGTSLGGLLAMLLGLTMRQTLAGVLLNDVGPLLGAIPAVLVASTVSPQLALIVAGVYIVIQLIEGSVLVPLVMRNTIGISPLLVMLSLLVGAAAGGLLGALLAVPIVASAEIILSQLQAREEPVAQDPAAIETPDDDVRDDYGQSLPDSAESVGVVPG